MMQSLYLIPFKLAREGLIQWAKMAIIQQKYASSLTNSGNLWKRDFLNKISIKGKVTDVTDIIGFGQLEYHQHRGEREGTWVQKGLNFETQFLPKIYRKR